jgi:hypothetical protein
MGYRSDVGIMVNEKHLKEFSKVIEPLIRSKTEIFKTETGLIKGIYFESIKWYGFSDHEIGVVEEFLLKLPNKDYGFIVVGEDNSDIRIEGCPYDYGINLIRKIEIDCQ